jgi:two-component system sensor histidine kinase KdpD
MPGPCDALAMSAPHRLPRFNPYLVALAAVAAALGLALAVEPFAGVANVYLVFLTAVIGIAVRHGLGPSLFGSLLSVLACNFFFLPPLYTLVIAEPANIVTLGLFFVVALVTSNLAARARDEALAARQRAETTEALYDFSRRITGTVTLPELLEGVVRQIETMLPLRASLLLPDGRGGYETRQGSGHVPPIDDVEQSALRAAYPPDAIPAAGRSSLRLGERFFLPLVTTHGVIGLAGLAPTQHPPLLGRDDQRLLEALLDQAALAIERMRLAEHRDRAQPAIETERLRSAILASLSHDLKTPLASILGAITALRSAPELYDTAAREDLAATVQEEAERMTRFVGNLLDMTRLEAGAILLDRQPVDLGEVVGTALRRVGSALGESRVAVDLDRDLPMLDLDVVLLEQVLVNLLDNAAKYAPPGSTIRIEGRWRGDEITLAVLDEGPGVAEADLPRLFEKFYRADRGDRRRAGTGLGLAICRGFVQALGGTVEAANRIGHPGAVFTLAFPREMASVASEEDEP